PVSAAACARQGVPFVTGPPGSTLPQRERLDRAAGRIPIVLSPNMSVGVHVMLEAAALLGRVLGAGWDSEVLELHHRLKKDAPSGTALRLAEVVAKARGQTHRRSAWPAPDGWGSGRRGGSASSGSGPATGGGGDGG